MRIRNSERIASPSYFGITAFDRLPISSIFPANEKDYLSEI